MPTACRSIATCAILTARPDEAARARVPHRLYGFLDAAERGSAGAMARGCALAEIAAAHQRRPPADRGRRHRALSAGAATRASPRSRRSRRRSGTRPIELYRALGGAAFRERLAQLDPEAAARLPPGDRQRLVRAFEVVRATGMPIGDWQRRRAEPAPYRFATILLHAAARRRFTPPATRRFDADDRGRRARRGGGAGRARSRRPICRR